MTTTKIDTIRAVFTYMTAFLISIGGLASLVLVSTMAPDTKTIVGAFIGGALTFLFGQEVQTRTARQTNTAQMAGGQMHANGIAGLPPDPGVK